MKLTCNSDEQFRDMLNALFHDVVDARFHFNLHQDLSKLAAEYAVEFSQAPIFWGLTLNAHMDAVLVRLCRTYDPFEQGVLTLPNLLHTIQANLNLFDESTFRQRLKRNRNAFADALATQLKKPDEEQLKKDIAAVSDSDPLVRKLIKWRHNFVAHRNRRVAVNLSEFTAKYPLLFREMDELLDRAVRIGNHYSLMFDASAQSTMMVGRDDYQSILKAVREHVQQYERRFDELKQHVADASATNS